MTVRRLDAGPLLAFAGAVLLLVSLFLHWYRPGLTAWDVFEVLDILLAALAITGALSALALMGASVPAPEARWLPWTAAIALAVVVITLLDRPPVVGEGDVDTGLWLALAGAACMAAGALLAVARIAIHFDVQPRRTRVAAVDHRTAMAAPGPGPAPAGDPTPAADPAPVVPVGATSDPLIPPVEAAPEPPGKSPPTGTEETRKLPDFTHPEDATGTRVEEPARGRRRRSP